MSELYWITRLDAIGAIFTTIMVVGVIIVLLFGVIYYINNGQAIYEDSVCHPNRAKEYRGYANTCLKGLRYSIPLTIISTIFFIFTPTTKQALIIYGIGGTINYLQSNPTAKKLPDKCLKALESWVDSYDKKERKEEKKE